MPPWIESISRWADEFQQRHAILGFPYAVVKKYGDDQAGRSAALVAYYSFVAIFPLLLVLVTLTDLFLRSRPDLQQQLKESVLERVPWIAQVFPDGVNPLSATGPALVIGIVGALIAARGMATAMIDGGNAVWNVPFVDRPGFPGRYLRVAALTVTVSVGLTASIALAGVAASGSWIFGGGVVNFVVATALTALVYLASFRLAVSSTIPMRSMWRGALLGAFAWNVLLTVGALLVDRTIVGANAIYGTFAVVIGVIAYLSIAANMTLFALEFDAVREKKLWPRTLIGEPRLPADLAAFEAYVNQQRRSRDHLTEVRLAATTDIEPPAESADEPTSTAPAEPAEPDKPSTATTSGG